MVFISSSLLAPILPCLAAIRKLFGGRMRDRPASPSGLADRCYEEPRGPKTFGGSGSLKAPEATLGLTEVTPAHLLEHSDGLGMTPLRLIPHRLDGARPVIRPRLARPFWQGHSKSGHGGVAGGKTDSESLPRSVSRANFGGQTRTGSEFFGLEKPQA